jgi:hypothetical protein
MSGTNSIHMGHGQMVDIVEQGPDRWELIFSEAGKTDYAAPPLKDIKVEAIDTNGAIHALSIAASGKHASIVASGRVAGAYRVRVMVMHGDHVHSRESLLPGKYDVAPKAGVHGGSVASFSTASIEAKLIAPDAFELRFASPQGAAMTPPAAESIILQAIGPKAEDYQIRNLAVRQGDTPGTLVASGKIKDATYLRLALKSDATVEVRSVPVIR